MNAIKVRQMKSLKSYNPVPNQFEIHTKKYVYFQSYQTIIARTQKGFLGKTTLDKNYWDYSATTLKYLKSFLGTHKSKKEIEKDIKTGVYKLSNLN